MSPDDLSVQHPRNDDGTYAMHCHVCGHYVDDIWYEPSADYMCDKCLDSDLEEEDAAL